MSSDMSQPIYVPTMKSNDPVTRIKTGYSLTSTQSPSWWLRWKLRAKQIWYDTWLLEFTALIISTTCGIGIYATLGSLNGKPLPALPKTLTLNTIIAFLGTIAKSALILMVTSCIGQLKWKWYQRTRSVQDARLFDDASRGPLGSIQMLLEHRGRSIACLGALILILALLFDPFVQQAVVYPEIPVLQPSPLARANQSWVFLADLQAEEGLPSLVKEALDLGVWSSGFTPEPSCPSSDCTWDTFTSLGLCSSCGPADPPPELDCNFNSIESSSSFLTDIFNNPIESQSCVIKFRNGQVYHPLDVNIQLNLGRPAGGADFLIVAPDYGIYEIFNGETPRLGDLTGSADDANAHTGDSFKDTIQGVKGPLLALAAVHFGLTGNNLTIAKAEECTLNFCLRDYSIAMTNYNLQVNISNIRNGSVETNHLLDKYKSHFNCWVPENETLPMTENGSLDYLHDPQHFSFCMLKKKGPFHNWGISIAQYIVGNVSQSLAGECFVTDSHYISCTDYDNATLVDSTWNHTFPWANTSIKDSILRTRQAGIDVILPNIAESITLLNLKRNGVIVEGKVRKSIIYVRVRWAWLALPTCMLGSGAFLFFYTAIDAKRHGIRLWKSSALAFLYHGLETAELEENDMIDDDKNVEKVSGMELRAAKLNVRLIGGHGNGRTVMQKSECLPPATVVG